MARSLSIRSPFPTLYLDLNRSPRSLIQVNVGMAIPSQFKTTGILTWTRNFKRYQSIALANRGSAEKTPMTATTTQNLKRDIIVIVSIKTLIVVAAAFFVFGPHQRPRIDDQALNKRMLDSLNAGKIESLSR